jgi:hypothetical protein
MLDQPKRGPGRPFVKGQSGNPAGRKKVMWGDKDVLKIAREYSPAAMRTLVEIFQDKSVTPGVRATCAEKIIERAYGKAPQVSTHIHARAKPQDLSDDQLLRIIAGEPLTSVLADPLLIEHDPTDNTETSSEFMVVPRPKQGEKAHSEQTEQPGGSAAAVGSDPDADRSE